LCLLKASAPLQSPYEFLRYILTTFSFFRSLRAICIFICSALLSACATSPNPASVAGTVNFGEQPTNYKQIVKNYLDHKREGTNLDLDKVDFLNEPNKYIDQSFMQEKFGYRVCALIPTDNNEDMLTHFFLINNGKVIKHAYDTGMISLSNRFCNTTMLTSERRVNNSAVAVTPVNPVDEHGFKYITCQTKSDEIFFAFSPEKKQLLQQEGGKQIAKFDIQQLSETFIVATNKDSQISINRISGTMLFKTKKMESKSHCELTSQQRF
jgi:hypothetical protein